MENAMQYWIFQAQIENGSLNNSSLFFNLPVIYPLAIIAEGTVLKILDNDQFILLSHTFILTYLPYWEAQYSLLVGSDTRVALTLLQASTHFSCYSEYSPVPNGYRSSPPDFWWCISLLTKKPVQQVTCWPSTTSAVERYCHQSWL